MNKKLVKRLTYPFFDLKILDHWAKFKEFDCNGDQMLDVEEVSLFSLRVLFTSYKPHA